MNVGFKDRVKSYAYWRFIVSSKLSKLCLCYLISFGIVFSALFLTVGVIMCASLFYIAGVFEVSETSLALVGGVAPIALSSIILSWWIVNEAYGDNSINDIGLDAVEELKRDYNEGKISKSNFDVFLPIVKKLQDLHREKSQKQRESLERLFACQ